MAGTARLRRYPLPVVDQRADDSADHASGSEVEALVAATAVVRRGGENAIGKARERHRLQDHPARATQRREEEAFSTEERRLDSGHHLNVVIDLLLHRDQTSGVDAKQLSWAEGHFMQGA